MVDQGEGPPGPAFTSPSPLMVGSGLVWIHFWVGFKQSESLEGGVGVGKGRVCKGLLSIA